MLVQDQTVISSANADADLHASTIAATIKKLDQPSALSLAARLNTRTEELEFCLGGVLNVINDMGWWSDSHTSFDAFVFDTYGFHVRQAQHLMRTYSYLTDKQIGWESVRTIGSTKLRHLVNAEVLTAENAANWAERAPHMTVAKLESELKFAKDSTQSSVDDAVSSIAENVTSGFTASSDVLDDEPDDFVPGPLDLEKQQQKKKHSAAALSIVTSSSTETTPAPALPPVTRAQVVAWLKDAGQAEAMELMKEVFPTQF